MQRFITRIRHLLFLFGNVAQGAWQQVIDKWYGNSGKRSYTSEGITFFPRKIHRNDPYHLNSPRNNWFYHANGKRSMLQYLIFFFSF